ncbi:hypothetical protein SDC9_202423 [bioreactor metagenome]|uniref:Uncharacterized protein n=1 Tax=bioreactor metagenome TaxID=1076179 RepID=A0A645IUA9_9ZZZZ
MRKLHLESHFAKNIGIPFSGKFKWCFLEIPDIGEFFFLAFPFVDFEYLFSLQLKNPVQNFGPNDIMQVCNIFKLKFFEQFL